ncbi:MAG: ATP-dependent DNA helicase [Eubacteriales bacterium]|nr:ATP-dependent DNA helicase [Eubacteriales bacterium]
MEKLTVRISVRNLVEFIMRSGNLDNRRGSMDKEAMQKGSRLHRKIQKQMGNSYMAEVPLKKETEYEDVVIVVEGRADGIFSENGETSIDEIKGIYGNVEKLQEPIAVHRAQAMCYGWIYAEKQNLDSIGIQMTYANLDTEEIRRFQERLTREELEIWYGNLLDAYHKWISWQIKWKKERNASMEKLEFPFAYREGQRQMVSSVYHSISSGKQIFIQAPTGVGKTMSTIFPAVRAVGEGKGETVFYLTAKTITRTVAEEAYGILQEKGLWFKVLTLTAKEKLCFCEKTECNPQNCPYAEGHYDRINDAVYELWTTQNTYDRETLRNHAEKWHVCPFEMSLDLALWVDGVICDYNYVFDPNVHLKRFFGEGVKGNYIFLIDEAHNLVERGREMYSAAICKEDILEVKKKVKNYSPGLSRALEKVNRQLLELKKTCEKYEILENPGAVSLGMLQVMGELDKFLEEPPNEEVVDEILDFYFCVRDFLNIDELVDENYVVYTENGEDGKFWMKLFCVNPAANLGAFLGKGISTVFFSATLLPMTYYRKLLSVREDDYGIYVQSPFDRKKRCILIGYDVSSRYTRRNYEEYRRIAEYIARTIWQKKGNYMAFFPSYRLMEEVKAVYETEFSVDWVRCISQTSGMNEREKEEFLEEFSNQDGTLVGFCVMGGVFSEGIDLMGDRLIGAIVVGTGLPQIGTEREILKNYYDTRGENGFDYAYRYPGMNKVLQASGRVIRTQEDIGMILLLDERFRNTDYRSLFPVEWTDRKFCTIENIEDILSGFWGTHNEKNELGIDNFI